MKKTLIWRLQLAAAALVAVTSAAVSAASSPPAPSASALRSTQATTQDTAAGLTKMTPTFANGERTPVANNKITVARSDAVKFSAWSAPPSGTEVVLTGKSSGAVKNATPANGERTPQVAMSAATGRDKLQTGGAHASLKHINPISLTPGGGSGDITAASLSIPNLWETAS